MDLRYTADDDAFRRRVRAWLTEQLEGPFAAVRGKGAPGREHEAVDARIAWEQTLGAAGFVGMSWPREFGGQDLTLTEQLVFWEEYAAAGGPGRIGVVGDWLLGPTLIAHGTRAQQQRFLPRILDGTERWCQGYSEPDAGSDLAALRTRAERDGDQWVVNGHKIWTSMAHLAHWAFVLCRTGPADSRHRGISYLLVPMDQPGVAVRPIRDATGGDTDFSEVHFDNAQTDAANVVGEVNGGWGVAMSTAYLERGVSTVGYQLSFGRELERVVAEARRHGRTSDAAVRQRLAAAWSEFQILRWSVLRTLSSVRAGNHSPVTNVYKMFWSSYHQRLGELAIDVLGLAGQLADDAGGWSDLQTMYFYSRAETIYGGSHQIQQNIVGERALGLPPEPRPS
jgi:alkylation response protein AidB-like acyl-CoA dehydrogenase